MSSVTQTKIQRVSRFLVLTVTRYLEALSRIEYQLFISKDDRNINGIH